MSTRADRIDAAIWAVAGAVILVASWRIDRLENLGINPWSIPGLTPIVVGGLMIAVAAVLGLRSGQNEAAVDAADEAAAASVAAPGDESGAGAALPGGELQGLRAALVACVICFAFAALSLGRGLPFAVDAAVFIMVFTAVFSWREWRAQARLPAGLLTTAVIAIVAASFIAWLFESIFLVRLP